MMSARERLLELLLREREIFGAVPRRRKLEYAAVAAVTVATLGLIGYGVRPHGAPAATSAASTESVAASAEPAAEPPGEQAGPATDALYHQIGAALSATAWPHLDPSIESVINFEQLPPDLIACGGTVFPDPTACTWGSPTAPTSVVVVGDSLALSYVGLLRDVAEESDGQLRVHSEAMPGCVFVNDLVAYDDQSVVDTCPARKQHAIDVINETKPQIVIISNSYGDKTIGGTDRGLIPTKWAVSMRRIVDQFRSSTQKIVFIAPPPADIDIGECYDAGARTPDHCVSRVTRQWRLMGAAEQTLASSLQATWIDSRGWFCNDGKLCPSFVDSTPTKYDAEHMTRAYAQLIRPAFVESLKASGVL